MKYCVIITQSIIKENNPTLLENYHGEILILYIIIFYWQHQQYLTPDKHSPKDYFLDTRVHRYNMGDEVVGELG